MGQCYYVEAELKFKNNDSKSFCESVFKSIGSLYYRATFDMDRGDINDPFGCFKILTSRFASNDDGLFTAEFDGSYGWFDVLMFVFERAFGFVDDGSYVDIYPDDGCVEIKRIDGHTEVFPND